MYERILIVVDASAASRAATAEGVRLAQVHGAEVVFFAILPRYVMPVTDFAVMGMPAADEFQRDANAHARRVLAAATELADNAGVASRTATDSSVHDADCVVDAARSRHCDLIVVPSVGDNAVMRLIAGSVIPGLITRATIPVLVVSDSAPYAHDDAGPARPDPRPAHRQGDDTHARGGAAGA